MSDRIRFKEALNELDRNQRTAILYLEKLIYKLQQPSVTPHICNQIIKIETLENKNTQLKNKINQVLELMKKQQRITINSMTEWNIQGDKMYLIISGRGYKVKDMKICANGTKDLCMYDDNGVIQLGQVDKVQQEKIIELYKDDIFIFNFYEPLPFPYANHSTLYMERTPHLDFLVKEFGKVNGGLNMNLKGKDYDAYLGRDYSKLVVCPEGFDEHCVNDDGTACPSYHEGHCAKIEEEREL